jgi:hypothetical protein
LVKIQNQKVKTVKGEGKGKGKGKGKGGKDADAGEGKLLPKTFLKEPPPLSSVYKIADKDGENVEMEC